MSRSDGKRPDGLTIFAYKHGKKLVWDITCVDTFASSYVHNTSKKPGWAAEEAEKERRPNTLNSKKAAISLSP